MNYNALIIDEKDNVAVVIEPIKKGDEVCYLLNNATKVIAAVDEIQIYHKISVRDVNKGEPIVKYGQHIGLASMNIRTGQHVHVQNVESHREEL